jgi:hypothetical protein
MIPALTGSADHLVPRRVRAVSLAWWREPDVVRMPRQPIRDCDGTVIQLGAHIIYAGRGGLKRGTIIRLRERGRRLPWRPQAGLVFEPELHVRVDGSHHVSLLRHPSYTLVLTPTQEVSS